MASVYRRPNSPFWWARFSLEGRTFRQSTGERNERAAQKEAERLEAEARERSVLARSLSFSRAAERFFEQKRGDLKPKTVRNYRISFTNLYGKLNDFRLDELDKSQLKTYITVRLRETGTVAIRRDLAFLSSLYTTACSWADGPARNPVKELDKSGLAEAKERNSWLTPGEVEKLLHHCQTDVMRRFVILAVETGMRWGELSQLHWNEVDMDRGVIYLGNRNRERTKTGDGRIVALSERALSTLESTPRTASGYLFENPRTGLPMTTLKKAWASLIERADMKGLRIHDLRHTFASLALQRGVSEIVLQAQLGHRTRSMTKRYAKPSTETLVTAFRPAHSLAHDRLTEKADTKNP